MFTSDLSNSWVIDQSYFRSDELFDRINSSQSNEFFILTEDTLVEMFKGKDWRQISRLSLSVVSQFKEKILVTNPIGLLREKEIVTKKACRELVDYESTMMIRSLLDEYNKGIDGKMTNALLDNISRVQTYKSDKMLNHQKNKELYLSIVTQFQEQMGPTLRNDLRKNKVKDEDIYQIILQGIEECFRNPDGEFKGMNEIELNCFIDSKPIYYFLYAMLLLEAFYWQKKSGLQQIKPQKITNYILDANYIIISIYSRGILSNDVIMNDLYHHLKTIEEIRFGNA